MMEDQAGLMARDAEKNAAGDVSGFLAAPISTGYQKMTIGQMQQRLLVLLNEKVRRGEMSQRRLARLTGFTQPHIHNVLKGARAMNPNLADAVLQCLNLSVSDLIAEGVPAAWQQAPLWQGEIGVGGQFPKLDQGSGCLPFPAEFLARFTDPVLLRVGGSERSMAPLIEPGDLVLMDQSETRRRKPELGSIYVIRLGGSARLCRCRAVGSSLLLTEENGRFPSLPDRIPVGDGHVLDVVKGTVVWVCREFPRF